MGAMPSRLHLDLACHALAAGGVVAYPTEAVWGLGCEPLNRHACEKILSLKARAPKKGFILIASDYEQVAPFVRAVPREKLKPALKSWPGAVTWLMPAMGWVPEILTGGTDKLAVRVTAHPVAAALCAAYGGPIVSTSANLSGHPAARTAIKVQRAFGERLDYVLHGDTGGAARPTPIFDLATGAQLRK